MSQIVIVEDDALIVKGLKKIVKSIDSEVKIKATGYAKDALEYSKVNPCDLFLLDIQLKDYSGIQLAKEIRENSQYKLTPIVFLTSIPTKELLAFKEIHCYDYIIKPFSEDEVKEVLQTIICHGIHREEAQKMFKVKQKNCTYMIPYEDIIYIETLNRRVNVATLYEKIVLSTYTLTQILKELPTQFIQCHKACVVNTEYIKKIDKVNDEIELNRVNVKLPLGRKYKDSIRDKCL